MRHLALSAVGRDRPGIVASVTGVLLRHGINVEDAQMTILRGHFTMMLVLAAPDGLEPDAIASEVRAEEPALEAVTVSEVDELAVQAVDATHTVTVYGVDHPGIVHSAAVVLADRAVNITDLNTRLVTDPGEEPLYALMMEVALPAGDTGDGLEAALSEVAQREGVEVSVHELEQDAL